MPVMGTRGNWGRGRGAGRASVPSRRQAARQTCSTVGQSVVRLHLTRAGQNFILEGRQGRTVAGLLCS